jgi:hypothetical protein
MLLRIKDTNTVPKEGWHYLIELTGYVVKTPSYLQLYPEIVKHCQTNHVEPPTKQELDQYLCDNTTIDCREGREPYPNQYSDKRNWPLLLRPLKMMSREGDRGLGDVVVHVIGDQRSDAFKNWYASQFHRDCGCDDRIAYLNRNYPL